MAKMDEAINKLKNERLDEITTPCSVFMTFESEEGVNRALDLHRQATEFEGKAHLEKWLNGEHEIEIQPASEPTDIIWENRHITPRQRICRSIMASLVVWALLGLAFWAIFICAQFSVKNLLKYPAVDCDAITELQTESELMRSAMVEWVQNQALENHGEEVSYAGNVQCFCKEQKQKGFPHDQPYGQHDL